MTKKLRSVGGFSLSELLLTMLIILLMTQLTVDGIPAVRRAYNRTVDTANAQVYLNTTMIFLRGELSLATGVTVEDNAANYSDFEGGNCRISNSAEGVKIIKEFDVGGDLPITMPYLALVGAKGFISSYETISYNNRYFTITGLQVGKEGETEPLAKLDEPYIIHTVNP